MPCNQMLNYNKKSKGPTMWNKGISEQYVQPRDGKTELSSLKMMVEEHNQAQKSSRIERQSKPAASQFQLSSRNFCSPEDMHPNEIDKVHLSGHHFLNDKRPHKLSKNPMVSSRRLGGLNTQRQMTFDTSMNQMLTGHSGLDNYMQTEPGNEELGVTSTNMFTDNARDKTPKKYVHMTSPTEARHKLQKTVSQRTKVLDKSRLTLNLISLSNMTSRQKMLDQIAPRKNLTQREWRSKAWIPPH